jgi:predicted nuclease of predicted toxin-antitoxin system
MPDPLKLYLDQCLRLEVAWALRHEGYDVVRASEVGHARADDSEILLRIQSERRVLITLDDHFGNWAVLPLREHPGVIRLKTSPAPPSLIDTDTLSEIIKGRGISRFRIVRWV